jgi:hypothetical protein
MPCFRWFSIFAAIRRRRFTPLFSSDFHAAFFMIFFAVSPPPIRHTPRRQRKGGSFSSQAASSRLLFRRLLRHAHRCRFDAVFTLLRLAISRLRRAEFLQRLSSRAAWRFRRFSPPPSRRHAISLTPAGFTLSCRFRRRADMSLLSEFRFHFFFFAFVPALILMRARHAARRQQRAYSVPAQRRAQQSAAQSGERC